MDAIEYQEVAGGRADARPAQPADRSATALMLIALSDNLQELGYSYEAYQVRKAAARLLRDLR